MRKEERVVLLTEVGDEEGPGRGHDEDEDATEDEDKTEDKVDSTGEFKGGSRNGSDNDNEVDGINGEEYESEVTERGGRLLYNGNGLMILGDFEGVTGQQPEKK